jgi:hypothetical protein
MVVQLIKPVLAPMLIAQAKRLRRIALELPEPSGERHGVARAPDAARGLPALSILIAGDS